MAQDEPSPAQDDIQESLTDLENDTGADDFDRILIRNARDERRIKDALHGQVQAFRKARTHPRVGVTLENLERHNNLGGEAAARANAPFKQESPPSSNGSAGSDPALRPPSGWGRKAKIRRDWMRTITADEPQSSGTPQHIETPQRLASHLPRPSVEDSPLSHKSSLQGTPATPRQNRLDDDWSFDLNNASVIASTPYIPRNTALEDIRRREIESQEEQAAATDEVEETQESSLEKRRYSRSMFARSTAGQSSETKKSAEQTSGPTERPRKQTNSWQTIGKSQPVTSQGLEDLPIVVYRKSLESVTAHSRPGFTRPSHRKDDSQDLLRRLARASSTPSPGRVTAQPHTAPAEKPNNSPTTMAVESTAQPVSEEAATGRESTTATGRPEKATTASQAAQPEPESSKTPRSRIASREQSKVENDIHPRSHPAPSHDRTTEDVAATPKPTERSLLNPKTPVVTGAWIDTPRPATVLKPPTEPPADSTKPTKNGSPSKKPPPEQTAEPEPVTARQEMVKPKLPHSALQAVVEEARNEYGESTINSLEELISPRAGTSEGEDDTLPDMQLPTGNPRNEAERVRHDENILLHNMHDRLRAASISIRQVGRGIGKLERKVEHTEETEENGQTPRTTTTTTKTCSCAVHGEQPHEPVARWTLWKGLKGLFYDQDLKRTSKWGWGLTGLSITLITFWTWFIVENLACEAFCHYTYASSMKGYGVTYNAPKFPFVIPTMTYRTLVRPWWRPLWTLLLLPLWNRVSGFDDVSAAAAKASRTRLATGLGHAARATRAAVHERVLGMGGDEVVRGF